MPDKTNFFIKKKERKKNINVKLYQKLLISKKSEKIIF